MKAVEVTNLRKRYKRRTAVDGIDLAIEEGEIFGILGRNGAGKTTTVESIAGLRSPDTGRIRVLGLDPRRDRAKVRQVLGVQLQESSLHSSLTVRELVSLYRTFYRRGREPRQLIDVVGLAESADVRFEKLSGGQQQRLSIALALVGDPRVVILDELTTGLDPEARRHMWATIEGLRAGGVTVLLVSHLMEEVERLCDRVALLDRGRVVAVDTPRGLTERAGLDQQVRFRVLDRADLDRVEALLVAHPEVESVAVVDGDRVTVSGTGELLQVVSTALVRAGVVVTETRTERATLDDAFLALTGHTLEIESAEVSP